MVRSQNTFDIDKYLQDHGMECGKEEQGKQLSLNQLWKSKDESIPESLLIGL